jgi:hypothetical protein
MRQSFCIQLRVKGEDMADRLALGLIPGTGWSARDIQMVAHEAEDAGFDAIFTVEVNNDALVCR